MPTVHLIVKGKVQGVFYRASAREKARELGLTGWIKNTPEGNVELTASGMAEEIREFTEWCRKGPENAIVTHVESIETAEERFHGFSIIR